MNSYSSDGVVIVGGGLAGQRCAETLRRQGYEGPIRIVCAEPHPPYDRPPLSKEILRGEQAIDSLAFRPPEWYAQHDIELLLGVSAVALRASERRVSLSDGSSLRYWKLLIATGSRPRTLPLVEGRRNVSALRTVDEAHALSGVLRERPRLAIVGAGFIGQEVAATARALGAEVTMIEAAPCPLVGVLGTELGDWFARLHRAEGVEVLTGATVTRAVANGDVRALHLSDGTSVETDHVVVGIGAAPEVQWLADSGIDAARGVPAGPHGHTEIDDVFAVGDAAATYDAVAGAHVPGSHWEAAGRQGARAARAMLGLEPGTVPVTSFWTDQYGLRIQYMGHARLADGLEIDGQPEERNFTATFTRAGRPVAALLVDRPRSLPAARKAIENGDTDGLLG
jgi:NADPH-dependent 2,4-dienoyl-CoA reductase/sulfur reductase-like enzyme